MASHDSQILSQTIWENLTEFTIDGELTPRLAKALPTVSDDKLTYSFELRDDVYFQNGQKLTAEDVKYSFEYMLDPANKAGRRPVFSRLSHVEIDSPTRLRVILKEPFSPWIYFQTKHMGIWPAGSRETYGDDYFRRTRRASAPASASSRSGGRTIMSVLSAIRTTGRRESRPGSGWSCTSFRRTCPASPFC